MIEEILERKNKMYRPDICNVDQIVLVFSAKRPDFNYALLDKFLVFLISIINESKCFSRLIVKISF